MRRPVTQTCAVEGCPRTTPTWSQRLCRQHHYHWEKYGTTEVQAGPAECIVCGQEFAQKRRDQVICGSTECRAERKREFNRERERRIFAETGVWRGRDQERKNPEIVERRKAVKAAEDAETPHRKRYPESSQARDARRRLRKQQNTPQPVELFTRAEIGDRDGWICQLCGIEIDSMLEYPHPRSQSLDHKLPISKGGAHTRENCQISHLECNVAKSDSLLDPAV